jgi:hypothetical protein
MIERPRSRMPSLHARPADFDTPAPAGAGTSPSGSRTARRNFPRRDVDEHQVHRPRPEPVLGNCLLPARQHDLRATELTHPRPFDVDLAAMEADQNAFVSTVVGI